jgi:hypothetical protein
LLKIFIQKDILLPCIWKKIFNHDCIGCGLSRAFIQLVQFKFTEAYHYNKLIYIVLFLILFLVISDIKDFLKKSSAKQNMNKETDKI